MGNQDTISPEQAQEELDSLLKSDCLDLLGFARGNFCLRVLGCPVGNNGKPAVIKAQTGDDARHLWDFYADARESLKLAHEEWREREDFE